MNNNQFVILLMALMLGMLGFLSGFCLALAQGMIHNDWWYMVIYVVIAGLGITAIVPLLKNLMALEKMTTDKQ